MNSISAKEVLDMILRCSQTTDFTREAIEAHFFEHPYAEALVAVCEHQKAILEQVISDLLVGGEQ